MTEKLLTGTLSLNTNKQNYQFCSNDAPGLILTYFIARSNLVPYAVVWEKGKTKDFSETIVVYDIKVDRCSQLELHEGL